MLKLSIDASRCIQCAACVEDCPASILRMQDPVPVIPENWNPDVSTASTVWQSAPLEHYPFWANILTTATLLARHIQMPWPS